MDSTFLILSLAALVTGFSKFSVGGMGMLILPILMIAYPGPEVLGILIPMYLWVDLAVMLCYRKSINWQVIARMAPLMVLGMILGSLLLADMDAGGFKLMIGVVILAMLALGLWLDYSKAYFMRHPLVAKGTGLLAGFISMTTNTAGPLISLYLMEQKLEKNAYLSTRSWLFVIVNLAKIPLAISLGLLTWESTQTSLLTLPGIALGALVGSWLVGKLRLEQFKWMIRGIAALAAVKLFLFS